MTARPSYLPGRGKVLHVYAGRETELTREECNRIADWLARQIASPAWSDDLTEARKLSLASLQSAMAAAFPEQQERVAS